MPVVRKKGALFPVYHDSPPSGVPARSHIHKKDVLAGRSPTQRQKTKSFSGLGSGGGTGSLKPSPSTGIASSALQSAAGGSLGHAVSGGRKTLGGVLSAKTGNTSTTRGLRDPLSSSKTGLLNSAGKEKENLRSLGMGGLGLPEGKMTEKLLVFVDDGAAKPGARIDARPRTQRVLREKPMSDVRSRPGLVRQKSSTTSHTSRNPNAVSTVRRDVITPIVGQENIAPAGENIVTSSEKASHRTGRLSASNNATTTPAPPAMSTRMLTRSSTQHDSAMEDAGDPESSPYIAKPRLRKLKPTLSSPHQRKMKRVESTENMTSLVQPVVMISSQTTSIQVTSSQSQAEEQEDILLSSPLIERPRTRKATISSLSSSSHPKSLHHSKFFNSTSSAVEADPVLCDVSEAYGADTSLQPVGFQGQAMGGGRGTHHPRARASRSIREKIGVNLDGLPLSVRLVRKWSRNPYVWLDKNLKE
ncbi:hypothetical protein QFC19_000717 [Naganishia cerealis]|uniref:Uncharacterized protein n=1 Tax=Naganishia cerealis TaxID=610337 RepID=A0ACC2WKN1_9TREE|nr:hypothetical protein QFC19_000717 [Naganishia cerealis]